MCQGSDAPGVAPVSDTLARVRFALLPWETVSVPLMLDPDCGCSDAVQRAMPACETLPRVAGGGLVSFALYPPPVAQAPRASAAARAVIDCLFMMDPPGIHSCSAPTLAARRASS